MSHPWDGGDRCDAIRFHPIPPSAVNAPVTMRIALIGASLRTVMSQSLAGQAASSEIICSPFVMRCRPGEVVPGGNSATSYA